MYYYCITWGWMESSVREDGERLKGFPAMQRVATRGQTLINFWCVLPTLTIREEHNNTLYIGQTDPASQPVHGLVWLSYLVRAVLYWWMMIY